MRTFLKSLYILAILLMGWSVNAKTESPVKIAITGSETPKGLSGDFYGVYTRKINGKTDTFQTRVSFSQENQLITGTFYLGNMQGEISNGRIEGNKLIFTWKYGNLKGTGYFNILHSGLTLKGEWNGGYQTKGHAASGSWELYRN